MSHVRQQIREACAALVTGLATTGNRVFQSRMLPQDSLPCLLVSTNDESVEGGDIGNLNERRLQLVIRGFAKGNANLDDTLDTIAAEVETAMAPKGYALRSVEVDFDDSLEKPVGSIALKFEVLYFTRAGSPGVSA